MKRGDLVSVVLAGDFGKPRPALVIQSDRFEGTGTVTLLLISSELVEASSIRLTIEPSSENGLHKTSQVMIDKAVSVKREKLGPVFGRLNDETMLQVTRAVAVFFHVV